MNKTLKSIKLNEKPSITICVMGQMKSGKSTLINALVGHQVAETSVKRATLSQCTLRLVHNDQDDNVETIRTQIKNKNQLMKKKDKLEKVDELDCKIQSSLFRDLTKNIKSPVNIIDTIGFNEDAELGNDQVNFQKLRENIFYTDIYVIPTKPDALLQGGDEQKMFRTLLGYIKESNVKPIIYFLVNKKDQFEDGEEIMTECHRNVEKEIKKAGLQDTIKVKVFPISARFIGLYRMFLDKHNIDDIGDKKQVELFVKEVLGKRKATRLLEKINTKEGKDILNRELKEELKESDWKKDTGFHEIETELFEEISKHEDDVLLHGYQSAIRDNFTNYNLDDNKTILEEILKKIQFTHRYKNNKCVDSFKEEYIKLVEQLNVMYINDEVSEGKINTEKIHRVSMYLKTIFEFVNDTEDQWFIKHKMWELLQNQIVSSLSIKDFLIDRCSRKMIIDVIHYHTNKSFHFIDILKKKVYSHLICSYFKMEIEKINIPDDVIFFKCSNSSHHNFNGWRKITYNEMLHDGAPIKYKGKTGILRIKEDISLENDGSIEQVCHRSFSGYNNKYTVDIPTHKIKREKKYYFLNIRQDKDKKDDSYYYKLDPIDNIKDCEINQPSLTRKSAIVDVDEHYTDFTFLNMMIRRYYTILLDDDKKDVLERYLQKKEAYYHSDNNYIAKIQRLVNTRPETKPILYDYLNTVIHTVMSRDERFSQYSRMAYNQVSIYIEELYCKFMLQKKKQESKNNALEITNKLSTLLHHLKFFTNKDICNTIVKTENNDKNERTLSNKLAQFISLANSLTKDLSEK